MVSCLHVHCLLFGNAGEFKRLRNPSSTFERRAWGPLEKGRHSKARVELEEFLGACASFLFASQPP
jgi:hypothetical protein